MSDDDELLRIIQGPSVAEKAEAARRLESEAQAAFRSDVSYIITMAREAHKAYVKDLAKREAETDSAVPESP